MIVCFSENIPWGPVYLLLMFTSSPRASSWSMDTMFVLLYCVFSLPKKQFCQPLIVDVYCCCCCLLPLCRTRSLSTEAFPTSSLDLSGDVWITSSPTQRWAMESGCLLCRAFWQLCSCHHQWQCTVVCSFVPFVCKPYAICITVCVCSAVFDFHHSTGWILQELCRTAYPNDFTDAEIMMWCDVTWCDMM